MPSPTYDEKNRLTESLLDAFFEEINDRRGIYGRKIELVGLVLPNQREKWAHFAADFLRKEEPFAVISPVLSDVGSELAHALESSSTPLIGTECHSSDLGSPTVRNLFFVRSAVGQQVGALLHFAEKRLDARKLRTLVVHDSTGSCGKVVAEHRELEWDSLAEFEAESPIADVGKLVEKLRERRPEVVVFGTPGWDLTQIFEEMERGDWRPVVLAPAACVGSDLFRTRHAFELRIFLSYPNSPQERKVPALRKFAEFADRQKLVQRQLAVQLDTYVAANLLTGAIKQAGRDLRRNKVIGYLESLRDFETGLTPPLTFSANRRIGSQGAYIFSFDPKTADLQPVSEWVKYRSAD